MNITRVLSTTKS